MKISSKLFIISFVVTKITILKKLLVNNIKKIVHTLYENLD